MKKYIVMDSEYCSMGRWISVIVGEKLKMKLYEGKDLVALADEDWLTEEYLKDFDDRIADMSEEEVKNSDEIKKVHQALSKAILKAIENGPCIIHERVAGDILEGKVDCLKVLLYNTSMEHRIPRAIADKTYDLSNLNHDELVKFINREDRKRKVYRDALSVHQWGKKESYDICLDSDVLSREKCAEVLIEAASDCKLNLDKCAKIIKSSFDWTK